MVPTLLDLTTQTQLATLGRLLWQRSQQARLLAVGSSAVAQALVAYWAKPVPTDLSTLAPADGPVFAWAGSPPTREQSEHVGRARRSTKLIG